MACYMPGYHSLQLVETWESRMVTTNKYKDSANQICQLQVCSKAPVALHQAVCMVLLEVVEKL